MIATRDATEHAGRFALAAGRQQHDFLRWQLVGFAQLEQAALRDIHEAQLARDAQVFLHAATDDRRLAAQLVGGPHHLPESADVRRERGDQDAAWRGVDELLKGFSNARLGCRPAALLDAHAIAQKDQDAFVAELAQSLVVGRPALYGGRIELEVSRMEQRARLCANHQANCVGNTVIDSDRLDLEWANSGVLAFTDGVLDDTSEHAMLFQLDGDQPEG